MEGTLSMGGTDGQAQETALPGLPIILHDTKVELAGPSSEQAPSQPQPSASRKRSASESVNLEDDEQSGGQPQIDEGAALPPSKRSRRSRKKAKVTRDSEGVDEGEIQDSTTGSDTSPGETTPEESLKTPNGWNRGVNNGLRTSFASKTQDAPRKASLSQASENAGSQAPKLPIDQDDNVTDGWAMPAGFGNFSKALKKSDTWEARFDVWCRALVKLNKDQEGIRDPALVKDAWYLWLQRQQHMPNTLKAIAQKEPANLQLLAGRLEELLSPKPMKREPRPDEPSNGQGDQAGPTASSAVANQGLPINRGDLNSRISAGTTQTPVVVAPGANKTEKSNGKNPVISKRENISGWTLPPALPLSDFDIKSKDLDVWQDRFEQWCRAVVNISNGKITTENTRILGKLYDTYSFWIGNIDGLSKSKSASARRGATEYLKQKNEDVSGVFPGPDGPLLPAEWAGLLAGGRKQEPANTQPETQQIEDSQPEDSQLGEALSLGEMSSDGHLNDSVMSFEGEDIEYKQRYFPGLGADDIFCVKCASRGHSTTRCPETACRFCQSQDHRSLACVTIRRCTKCYQPGHTRMECVEKLLLAPDERVCVLCESHKHWEPDCIKLWRTFDPSPGEICKIRSMLPYCYTCGEEGHYGPECRQTPLTKQLRQLSWETWSRQNLEQYLDPECEQDALSSFMPPGAVLATNEFDERPSFGGKSIVPQRHVFFEAADDDDDNESFIRPPVQRNTRSKPMTFNGAGNGNGNGNGNGSSYRGGKAQRSRNNNPPLPPGPPPQGNQQGGRRQGYRGGFSGRQRGGYRGNA
ncbi:hypothetical protein B0T25DRAFT_127184 [Lasiosphaeria hispida]|uniref:CCHC-type domain-containing protein n=1 Tax=Lasiosphaeria hispida TaxID=260671 RepID=A0AAJ0HRV1_9PEZI|nr:hypothetical protein B0T25DRAFT_127184 [Lasiosphaeria hispida]